MNLEFYRNYIKVAELRSISGAAREIPIAQSALSSQIKQFEEEYGAALFIRGSRNVEMTEAGRIVYESAKKIISLADAAHRDVEAFAKGARGTLRIGMTQAFPDAKITTLLLGFHRENPEIRFEFYEVSSYEIMSMIRSGMVEIGIVRNAGLLPPEIREQLAIEQRLCVYCGYHNPWITPYETEVPVASLDRVPIAISRGFATLLEDLFRREMVEPDIMSISTSRSNPMMWARSGSAVAVICTDESETADDAESFCRPLISDDPEVAEQLRTTRSFITLRGGTLSPAAKLFLEFCRWVV